VTQVRTPHDRYADINWREIWQFGNFCVLFLFAFCLSSSCVLCAQCCQCLWVVNFWLPLRFSLTFIGLRIIWQFWNGWYVDIGGREIWLARLFSFLCWVLFLFLLFVYLRLVSCVSNVASVSGFSLTFIGLRIKKTFDNFEMAGKQISEVKKFYNFETACMLILEVG